MQDSEQAGPQRPTRPFHAHLGDGFDRAADAEDALVYTRYNFRDTRLDASALTQVCYIFAGLADDDASLFGRHKGAQSERVAWGACRGCRARVTVYFQYF